MNTNEMVDLLKGMLKRKRSVIETLAEALDESVRIQKGMSHAKEHVLKNPSAENISKMLNTTMSTLETQSKTINQLILINLVYASGGDFTGDVVQCLNKLGHGQEALKEMFKQKMEGKS